MAPDRVKRKISAILSADVAGYSKLMEADESGTVQTLRSYQKTIASLIEEHDGRVIDSPGDNLLAEFGSVVDAVQCAVEVQYIIKAKNAGLPEYRKMDFRIGINLGDIIEEEDRIYGEGVNVAARVEGLADPGGICISRTAYDQIVSKLDLGYEDLGEHSVKNIERPVQVYRIPMDSGSGEGAGSPTGATERGWRNIAIAAISFIIVGIGAIAVWTGLLKPAPSLKVAKTETVAAPDAQTEGSLSEKPSIAVLPFDNLSGNPEQDYFVDGMVAEITAKLSVNRMLTVIARKSTFFYQGKQVTTQQVGRELNARYIVEGSIRKADDRIRITAKLIDAETEGHLWADTYEREFQDVFRLQDEIAQQIVASLNIESLEAEKSRIRRIPTTDLSAYDHFLRGMDYIEDYWRDHQEENITKAREHWEKAVEIDPEYAEAQTALGIAFVSEYYNSLEPELLVKALATAQAALGIDDTISEVHVLLSRIHFIKNQYEWALKESERAISLNPNSPEAYYVEGNSLLWMGRYEEARLSLEKAVTLHPRYPPEYLTDLSTAYQFLGQYETAIVAYRDAIVRDPNSVGAYQSLAFNYLRQWATQQNQDPRVVEYALEMAEKGVSLKEKSEGFHSAWAHAALGHVYLHLKQHEKAASACEKGIDLYPKDTVRGSNILAIVYSYMGRAQEAVGIIERNMQAAPLRSSMLWRLGDTYRFAGQQIAAENAYKGALDSNPAHEEDYGSHLGLAILYSEQGRKDAARVEAAKVLKLVPNFSVDVYGERIPYKDPSLAERDMVALRKAGLK